MVLAGHVLVTGWYWHGISTGGYGLVCVQAAHETDLVLAVLSMGKDWTCGHDLSMDCDWLGMDCATAGHRLF
jgi:hypothetical protein